MDAPAPQAPTVTRFDVITWLAAAVALLLILRLHLLPSLLSGLLVFELVNLMVPGLRLRALGSEGARVLAVVLIASGVIAAMTATGFALTSFFRHSDESVPALFQSLAQSVEKSREQLPAWLLGYLPDSAEELRVQATTWLREHADTFQLAGESLGRGLAHVLIGMIIGALLSLQMIGPPPRVRPLGAAIYERAARVSIAFRNVVFAQISISAINTVFTAVYLAVLLPMFGVHLPLTKTMILVTFIAGLIPILGNLTSNTVIVIVSLSNSLAVALASLVYLIVIHKLEYFLNARIVGSRINARAWELLLAMLVMEAAFGLPGLVAAPIYYAYFKTELREKGLI